MCYMSVMYQRRHIYCVSTNGLMFKPDMSTNDRHLYPNINTDSRQDWVGPSWLYFVFHI